MAVGLDLVTELNSVRGIKLGVCEAGIKYPNRHDLVIIEICEAAHIAAVFTKNQFCAAPVLVSKKHLGMMAPRCLVINTGNANAGTGEQGLQDAMLVCQTIGELTSVPVEAVLPFSTGVIGENLPMDKFILAIPRALQNCRSDNWVPAAKAIMTTDTLPKGVSRAFECDGKAVIITGIAKGSGMICPNMATLLSFIATDAKIDQEILQELLNRANNFSFNSITVDSDTSTNDSCLLIATGRGDLVIDRNTPDVVIEQFYVQLLDVMQLLAQGLIRDGEGATKFISVTVQNGANEEECRQIAYTVAHSPLVKTAFFASDPNWGRILAAVGRAGIENLSMDRLKIYLGGVCIVENGARAKNYSEDDGQLVMNREEIDILIDLFKGEVSHTIWTSDLSYDYVKINAEYRS